MAEDAHQPPRGLALLVAQRAREVGEHEQLVRPPALAERAAPQLPAPAAAGKVGVQHPRRLAVQALGEPQLLGAPPHQPLGRVGQQPLAGAVHQPEALLVVEGEDGDVDLLHHARQERGGLERAEPLLAQGLAERVDLQQRQAEGVVAARAAGADREVLLAQRGQHVGERLEGAHDPLAQGEDGGQPEAADQQRDGPADLGAVAADPDQDQRERDAGQARQEGQQDDAPLVIQAGHLRLRARGL